MSDPATGTVEPDRLNESALPPAMAAAPFGVSGELKPGERWHDFIIEAAVPGVPHQYLGDHIGLMEKVVVRAFPIVETTEWRRGAWERLCLLPDSKTMRCIEAHEETGWRYEVTAAPPVMNLREWIACHRPKFSEIEALVRQLAAIISTLHSQGVVHLNICPDAVFIDETGQDPIFLLGGLHEATLYTQPKLMPSDVNPFYAPPEAMDLTQHRPGTRLCAWDWWSVGRIVQEFLLGRHVLSLVTDRDVSKMTPELRVRARQLLLEIDPPGMRAGALDYMPGDPSTAGLLRGLLTSSFEARWGLDAVQRWLRRETVRDHYDLPSTARMWNWRGRGFMLPEAAEFFTQAANWEQGENTLFHPEDPDSLAFFLNENPAQREDWARLQAVCELTESRAWEQVPAVVRRTVTAAAAWLALAAGSGARGTFRVRGETIDLMGLTALLKAPTGSERVALVMALLTPAVIEFVEPLDGPSARVLKTFAAIGGAAVQQALQHGWLDPDDSEGHAQILRLALQRGVVLRERVALLHETYATNRLPELARMMADRAPGAMELVTLAYTVETPDRHGYVTHADWRRERYTELRGELNQIGGVFFWVRLRQLLTVARLWGASWQVFAAITLLLTAVTGWLGQQPQPAATVALALLLPRIWLWWRVRNMVCRFAPDVAPWTSQDGLKRSRIEATKALAAMRLNLVELSAQQGRLQAAMAEFASAAPESEVVSEPRWWDMCAILTMGALLALVMIVQAADYRNILFISSKPIPAARARVAPVALPSALTSADPDAIAAADRVMTPERLLATGRYELVDDGFGPHLRGPLKRWNFFAPDLPAPLAVQGQIHATPAQTAFALVSGTLLVEPYLRASVNVLLAVRVPTTRGIGLLVFNTRDRQVMSREVQLVRELPTERTWYQFGAVRVVYLGTPPALKPEISLAQP